MVALKTLIRLARDRAGSMAVETAIVAPVLATMALGAFEASSIVSRQQQLQSAASEAGEIILAAANGTGVTLTGLKTILKSSLGLSDNQITLVKRYRCDTGALVEIAPTTASCGNSKPIYTYIHLTLTYTYTPTWTNFGIGSPVNYSVVRTVQVS